MIPQRMICSGLIFCLLISVKCEVTLSSLFSDNMVLQQNSSVNIWGWTDEGKEVTLTTSWNNKNYKGKANNGGYWIVQVTTPSAGGPYSITIDDDEELIINNILIGEVWLCAGQSNMEMPMKGFRGSPIKGANLDILTSKNDAIRFISVPRNLNTIPQQNFDADWKSVGSVTVSEFSATAYYYARLLQHILQIPIGLVEVSYSGSCVEAWTSRDNTCDFEGKAAPKAADSLNLDQRTPSVLFNGMLNPVIGYTIKGAIWYQGESNYINSEFYADRFSDMVKEWRTLWNQGDFPFYYAQIAPFDYRIFHSINDYREKYNSAYLREAQLKARTIIPNCEMAVTLDVGNEKNIHPADKKTVGERLALIALAKSYNISGIGYAPPVVRGLEVVGSSIIISFNNIPNGITSFENDVTIFEIAGEDEKFYPAQCWVRTKSVVLSSSKVKAPVAVRYAFRDYIEAQLFSTEGIPVPSFRTDNW